MGLRDQGNRLSRAVHVGLDSDPWYMMVGVAFQLDPGPIVRAGSVGGTAQCSKGPRCHPEAVTQLKHAGQKRIPGSCSNRAKEISGRCFGSVVWEILGFGRGWPMGPDSQCDRIKQSRDLDNAATDGSRQLRQRRLGSCYQSRANSNPCSYGSPCHVKTGQRKSEQALR